MWRVLKVSRQDRSWKMSRSFVWGRVGVGSDDRPTPVAVCCSVLQCVAVCYSVLQHVAVCCSVLQCVAVCCSLYQIEEVGKSRWKCNAPLQCAAKTKASLFFLGGESHVRAILGARIYIINRHFTDFVNWTFGANFPKSPFSLQSNCVDFGVVLRVLITQGKCKDDLFWAVGYFGQIPT